ncbi:MAG TPA: flagellar basal body P-ring protein FlgI [Caulobacteraceae bacterium]|jgi:flagellar P-ring protein precursor FlgI
MRSLRLIRLAGVILSLALGAGASHAMAASRIKDIVQFEGVRENKLVGYGLVVGLAGTGDSLRNAPMTKQSLMDMLERLGVNTRDATMDTKNVAAVMVTASLPAFAAAGSTVDISVAAMGDAKSLQGGTLLITPLLGADGEAYAVGQGTVETGSISAGGASGSSISKGVPTSGRIAGGASVEREVGFQLANMNVLRLTLRNPDFTTSRRVADVVNGKYPGTAIAENPTIVALHPPAGADMVSFVTSLENLEVEPDAPAKVVIDEVAGVIVMGENVRLSTVAIAQGNLTISIEEKPAVSQPLPFSQGTTQVVPQSKVKVDEEKGKKLLVIKEGASLAALVSGLNALGVTPRDMISILQAIKAAGALQADIQVM